MKQDLKNEQFCSGVGNLRVENSIRKKYIIVGKHGVCLEKWRKDPFGGSRGHQGTLGTAPATAHRPARPAWGVGSLLGKLWQFPGV